MKEKLENLYIDQLSIQNNLKFKKNFRGIKVVFLGPDGSGKSTIISNIKEDLKCIFPNEKIDYFHWRPNYLKPLGDIKKAKIDEAKILDVEQPHSKPLYNKPISMLKFIYYYIDYVIGDIIKIKPKVLNGNLVVFDRYYYDYFIDIKRYRMNISENIISVFNYFIPKPDITFLLIGDSEIIYERKKEISLDEVDSQIKKLIKNKAKFSNPVEINVTQDIDKVVYEVEEAILQYLKDRR
ncbi:hypothetical protein [Romboutsia timonensis]|uniref:hypothetical protein n=1 Tax=Romboutsia timonensis TaxID=1776391 RepID=UPI002A82218B|nr:hypothetical protein [Romboutsia timonensis]MDY3959067.1 hypothetical protein [Romboutsia timonensis]